jgi:hypothetical protein
LLGRSEGVEEAMDRDRVTAVLSDLRIIVPRDWVCELNDCTTLTSQLNHGEWETEEQVDEEERE